MFILNLQDPFDTHEFVERLAWRTMGTKARSQHDEFDPMLLHGAFEKMIADLKQKNKMVQQRVDKLEEECKDEEKKHWSRVVELQRTNQACRYSKVLLYLFYYSNVHS